MFKSKNIRFLVWVILLLCITTAVYGAVDLNFFIGEWKNDKIELSWETGTEVDHSFFLVWRSTEDLPIVNNQIDTNNAERLTDAPIQNPDGFCLISGEEYEYIDDDVDVGQTYYYYVESWNCDGDNSEFHGNSKGTGGLRVGDAPSEPPTPTATNTPTATATATYTPYGSVELNFFIGESKNNKIELRWETRSEVDHWAFFVWRSTENLPIVNNQIETSNAQRLTNDPILNPDGLCMINGRQYDYTDHDVDEGQTYYYYLESWPCDEHDSEFYGNRAGTGGLRVLLAATPTPRATNTPRASATASKTPTANATATHTPDGRLDLNFFIGEWKDDKIELGWETGTEVDHSAFFVWRSTEDLPIINNQIDRSSAELLTDAPILNPDGFCSISGHEYEYIDDDVEEGQTYYYYLESWDCDGVNSEFHGNSEATGGLGVGDGPTETPTPTATNTPTVTATPTVSAKLFLPLLNQGP